ncbi:MAG: hypothetical protein R3E58_00715 [Phycisphaerae bacterium]
MVKTYLGTFGPSVRAFQSGRCWGHVRLRHFAGCTVTPIDNTPQPTVGEPSNTLLEVFATPLTMRIIRVASGSIRHMEGARGRASASAAVWSAQHAGG